MPFVIRGPSVPAGKRFKKVVLNIDIAPTFADIAGIKPPRFVDGRSFLPLFQRRAQPWRRSFMVGRFQLHGLEQKERAGRIRFKALRTSRWTYVEYSGGERELYNHRRDPYQLSNKVREADPALVQALSSRLDNLSHCRAVECRRLENLRLLN